MILIDLLFDCRNGQLHFFYYLAKRHFHNESYLASRYGEFVEGGLKEGKKCGRVSEQEVKVFIIFDVLFVDLG